MQFLQEFFRMKQVIRAVDDLYLGLFLQLMHALVLVVRATSRHKHNHILELVPEHLVLIPGPWISIDLLLGNGAGLNVAEYLLHQVEVDEMLLIRQQ